MSLVRYSRDPRLVILTLQIVHNCIGLVYITQCRPSHWTGTFGGPETTRTAFYLNLLPYRIKLYRIVPTTHIASNKG